MQMIREKHSAVILAAGHSRRMGVPKLSLRLVDGTSFATSLVNGFLQFGCSEVIIVANPEGMASLENQNEPWPDALTFKINPYPALGRFYSLQTGLSALKCPGPVFLHNIDNPMISQEVLVALSRHTLEADYICPSFRGQHGHPVLLSEKVTSGVLQTHPPFPHMREFFKRFEKTIVAVEDANILLNINEPEAYQRLILP